MAKSRRKSKRRGSRRRQRGGHHSLVSTAAPYTPAAFAPPGGIYKPGGVNGLDGGYYYGVNVDQSLPDPIATSALFRQRGGRRRRKRKTRRHRHTKRCHTRRRRHRHTKRCRRRKRKTRRRRRRRRPRRRRRRRQKGGKSCKYNYGINGTGNRTFRFPSIKRMLTTVIPKDVLDIGYKGGNSVGNLYRGYVGERPKMPPVPYTNQPISQATNTLGYQPVDANNAYNNAIQAVNAGNTPVAQASY